MTGSRGLFTRSDLPAMKQTIDRLRLRLPEKRSAHRNDGLEKEKEKENK
jgi:hypothetical protein